MLKISLIFKLLIIAVVSTSSLFAKSRNLSDSMRPSHYEKRTEAIYNIGLAYYGDHWSREDLKRIVPMLQKRFSLATLYGPTKDSDGNITQHGGIFFVLSASHFMGKMARDFTLTPGDVEFTGRDAHRYESKKAKKKLIKKIQKAVKEFNEK
ncbi:hypothetical protein OAT67_00940 [Bacteriovoracaceae bacterium]|nr:hypothetical protein [Bacteriovoracaceae bacterium]